MSWYNPASWDIAGAIDKSMAPQNKFQAKADNVDSSAYQIKDQYSGQLGDALKRASQMGVSQARAAGAGYTTLRNTDMGASAAWGKDQQDFASLLKRRAEGQSTSAAETQLKSGLAQGLAQQRAQAASQRGVSAGLAARLAAQGGAQMTADTNNQLATLRAQEQAQAEQAYTGAVAQARGQELDTARLGQEANLAQANLAQQTNLTNAGFQQQTELQNQQMQLQAQQAREQAMSGYLQMGMTREQAEQQALADEQAQNTQRILGVQQINAGVAAGNQQAKAQGRAAVVGAVGSAVGGLLKFSDKRLKTDVSHVSGRDMRDFVQKLKAVSYRYKDPAHHGEGKHVGIMAQDAERSRVGKTFVVDTPEGKALDIGRGFGALLASHKAMHDRLAKLERAA
jgi:hypothetical protein